MSFTNEVKEYAVSMGSDLIGIAGIDRYENAPVMMRPQGILPEAKSVVVMALHHPDGCIEMGGKTHPQDIGPYAVQYTMNSMLDEISFRMGRFLEDAGWKSVPIVSSNIWRYRGHEGLREHFAPEVSHIHAAVAAGLADFGYSGLALTPEYGPRNRFVQVITSAELEPTPLLDEELCDDCGLCKKHCMSGALTKEINGWNEVKISGRVYRYANKNLWRCAWGEHFDLDLDLDIPEKVDEEVILEYVEKHGRRSGEFGSCLRYCLPAPIRSFDRSYTDAPRRKKRDSGGGTVSKRSMIEKIKGISSRYGCDEVVILSPEDLASKEVDIENLLPDGKSLLVPYFRIDSQKTGDAISESRIKSAASDKTAFAAYRISRILEDEGFSVVCHNPLDSQTLDVLLQGTAAENADSLQNVITSAELPSFSQEETSSYSSLRKNLKPALANRAKRLEIDLFGVASAKTLARLAEEVKPVYDGRTVLNARDQKGLFEPFAPEITEETLAVKTPEELLKGAKSAIVLGLHYNSTPVEYAGSPPAKTVGPYVFSRYESQFLLTRYALDLVSMLNSAGYRSGISFDPLGTGGYTASVRGDLHDKFSCRFAAVASGLATLSRSGMPVTRQFGLNQTFLAIITGASLAPDSPDIYDCCGDCETCIDVCPVNAFTEKVTIDIDGNRISFTDRDYKRCDWDKRYFLPADSGFGVMGSPVDLSPPREITPKALADALEQHDPITKKRPTIAEQCVIKCPLAQAT